MEGVAVVILNFNGRHFLAKFLPDIIEHSGQARIIVADNASSDDSVPFLKEHFPTVELILLDKNFGFAGGYNEALKSVKADFFVILNSDVAVTKDWLNPLISFLIKNPEYACVQPKIKSFHSPSAFEYAGAAGGFVDSLGYPYCRGRIFNTVEEDNGQYNDPIDVDWTSGACMVIRSEVYSNLGGFDSDFFAHMEEIDLCWRIRSLNWKLACIPESIVYHIGGGTLDKTSPQKTYLNFRNGLSLLVKNLPLLHLIWKLPIRLMLDGLAALKFALESSPSHLWAIIRAHFSFYLGLVRNSKKRSKTVSPSKRSIVLDYFIRKKKTYSELN